MLSVYKRELKSYFTTMIGYIPIVLITVMTGIFVKLICFDYGYPTMETALPTVALILIIAVPVLSMRSFADDRQKKVDLLLYSLPLSSTQIVLGKYFAILTVLAIPSALMLIMPFVLSFYGTVNIIMSFSAILAFFLLSAAMAAICMFMSSLTESQVIAAILGAGALIVIYAISLVSEAVPTTPIASFIAISVIIVLIAFVVYLFTKDYWIAFSVAVVLEAALLVLYITNNDVFTGLFQTVVGYADMFAQLDNFVSNELFDMTAVVYYASIAALFCHFTVQAFEKRRWN